MTRVVVAASIDNELGSRDIASVRRLQQAGYDVQFYYYLPKVPAEFSMIPSFNEELKDWKIHAMKMLYELGNKLDIPTGNRHFVDEILGPDRVFDEAKEIKADIILTNNKDELKQSILSRLFDHIGSLFSGKTATQEVPVAELDTYVSKELGSLKEARRAVNDEKISSKSQSKLEANKKPRTGTR